jgi:predicted Zn-dependent protease
LSGELWPPAEPPGRRASDRLLLQAVDLARLLTAANRGELRPVTDVPLRDYADAIYAWLVVACEEGRWTDAAAGVEHLAKLEPDSARRLRASLAVQLATGKAEAAALTAQRLLQLAPDDAELHFLCGQSLGRASRLDEARQQVRAARELAMQDLPRSHHVLGWCDQWLAEQGPQIDDAWALRKG